MQNRSSSRLGQMLIRSAAGFAAACLLAPVAEAQVVYEPFDAPAGSFGGNVNGLSGVKWVYGANTSPDLNVLSESFPPPTGLAQPIVANDLAVRGKDDNNSALSSAERLSLPDIYSGDLYLSIRINVKNINSTTANGTGAFFTGFGPAPGTNTGAVNFAGARVRLQKSPSDGTTFQIGIQNDVHNGQGSFAIGSSPTVFVNRNLSLNQPILVVARYHFNPGSFTDDIASLWVTPDSTTFGAPEAPAADASSTGCDTIDVGDPVPTIRDTFFRQNSVGADNMSVDDFRVGRSWASVVPKSGSTWSSTSDTNWGGSNWTGGTPDAINAFAYFDDSSSVHTVALGGTRTVGSLVITSASGYSLSGGSIVFDGGTGTNTHGSSQITLNAVKDATFTSIQTASSSISSNVMLNNDLYVSTGAGQTLALSGNIGQSTQASLIKFGGGTAVLSGANSYSGVTSIYAGTLVAGSSSALGSSGSLTFNGGTLQTNANLSFSGAVELQNADAVINTNGNTVTLSGLVSSPVLSKGLTKLGSGTLILSGSASYANATTVSGGALVLKKDAQAPVVTGAGAVLNAGRLILDYSGGGTDPTSALTSQLAANLSNNNTAGRIRTSAPGNANLGIGYFDDVANSRLTMRYTYRGDANLDGVVNALDFNALASNFGAASAAWSQGDFNYDGVVDTNDFTFLGTTFGSAALSSDLPAPAPGALVPEPAGMFAACALIGSTWMGRKRKRLPA